MYIADLTEVLCKRKRLQMPSSDWVLCLAELTLALPLDRTVASLEGRINLALVRRQWAIEHGLRPNDRRGGDPSGQFTLPAHMQCRLFPQPRFSSVFQSQERPSDPAQHFKISRKRIRSTPYSAKLPLGGTSASSPSTGTTYMSADTFVSIGPS